MTRETTTPTRVALLATGDEITHGDILNTNAQIIAQKLFRQGIRPGMHMSVQDNISEIEQSIIFLLSTHRALIITGGLGPTSDDLTRYALAKSLNRPLVFDEIVWRTICERFKLLGYTEVPDSNRQQALFPEGARIISNPQGTAAGCMILQNDQLIFMLPGPPYECLPMVDTLILPTLKKAYTNDMLYYDHWLLFGVSEGKIAEELDALLKPFNCQTGYRIAYPYLEFKIYSNHRHDFETVIPLIEKTIAPYFISNGKQTAAEMLQDQLEKLPFTLSLHDTATGGLLESILKTTKTYHKIDFTEEKQAIVKITGLTEYWEEKESDTTALNIFFSHHTYQKKVNTTIPLRGRSTRVKNYAVELICHEINQFLTTNDIN